MDDELVWCSIDQVAGLFDSRSISPVELAEAYLSRIDRFQKELNAYVTVTPERALEDARRAEAELMTGHRRGPLHGIPIGLKDLIDTAGIRTTAGSRAFADRVPSADTVVAERLRVAGTVLLGKHATHEFAYGGTTENEWLGPTRTLGISRASPADLRAARRQPSWLASQRVGSERTLAEAFASPPPFLAVSA